MQVKSSQINDIFQCCSVIGAIRQRSILDLSLSWCRWWHSCNNRIGNWTQRLCMITLPSNNRFSQLVAIIHSCCFSETDQESNGKIHHRNGKLSVGGRTYVPIWRGIPSLSQIVNSMYNLYFVVNSKQDNTACVHVCHSSLCSNLKWPLRL